jgi:predicted flap endonuclease-1-like 5' DNA nuclease
MMSFNLNEVALLLIVLVIGWLLGLIMSGRGKYRRLWRDEQLVHRNAIKDRDARIEAANARITELERRSAAPIGAATGTGTTVASAAHDRDDLSKINGISQAQEVSLNEAGYQRYGQIAALNAEQEAALETRLGLQPGTIVHEDWRKQANALEHGHKRGLFG